MPSTNLPPVKQKPDAWLYYAGFTALLVALHVYSAARLIDLSVADLGRHIKNGEIIVRSGTIPDTNLFSYTHPDAPFINHHWGTGVVFYFVHEWVGFKGLHLLNIAVRLGIVGTFFGLTWSWTRFELAVVAAILSESLIGPRAEIRPELFSNVFMVIFFVLLWQFRQGRLSGRWLWVLPPIMVLWVNLHIFFLFGLILVGIFLIDELLPGLRGTNELSKRRLGFLFAVLLLSTAATLVNPWGIHGALQPFTIFDNYGYAIIENKASWEVLATPYVLQFSLVFALVMAGAGWTLSAPEGRHRMLALLLVTLVTGALAWRYLRGIAVFGHFVPILLPLWWNRAAVLRVIDAMPKRRAGLWLAGVMTFCFFASPELWLFPERRGIGLEPGGLDAVRFIRDNQIRGPIFNSFNVGSYLIYGLYPEHRVFVDGRPEAYPASFFRESVSPFNSMDNEEHWQTLMARHDFNMIVLHGREVLTAPGYAILYSRRSDDPAWALVFLSERVIILVRRNAANKAVIDRFEIDLTR